MRIFACFRPQNTASKKEELSPAQQKTANQSYKIGYASEKPSILSRLFSRKKTDETTRLTDNRV